MRIKCLFSSIILMVILLVVCGRVYAAPLSNGLVAYYPFNGNANDASGNRNNGTVHGVTLTKDRFGKPNSAYKFDGINNYILVPDRASLRLKKFTIAAWVNPDYFLGSNRIVEKGNSNSYWLYINPGNNIVTGFYDGAYYDLISKNTIALNKWSFIVGTYDGALLKTYINGTLNSSRSISSQLYQSAEPLVIGWKYNGITTDHYSGLMDDIRIYNRALSAQEIQLLADRPSDHKVAGKNIGWCYPLQDLCNDKMICKTPVQNVTFGFMSYNNPSYPYHYAQDMTRNSVINKAYKAGDSVFAMANGRIIWVRNSGGYGGVGYNTMLVEYHYGATDGSTQRVYVMYGHVKNIKSVFAGAVPNTKETAVNIPVQKYIKIAELNDPGASWNHVAHLHLAVMRDSFPADWYAGYNASQNKNGRVRPFNLWNNTNGGAWSKDWVDIRGYQNLANKDEVFFDTYRPK